MAMRFSLLLVGLLGGSGVLGAGDVDTSDWVCEYCPFQDGVTGDYDVGVSTVSDDSAYLGNATGYDEEGTYANIDGDGGYASETQHLRWRIDDLGLDSRVVRVEGGQPGRYDYRLDWQELPYRQFITTSTVYSHESDASLTLPADWVPAPNTGGFEALDRNLANRDMQSDRQDIGLGGSYHLSPQLQVSADYRQRNNEGTRLLGGGSFTNASLLPAPFDYRTDELDLGLRYGGERGFLGVSWFVSDFDNRYESLRWQQPFGSAPGAEAPEIAQAPDNRFQQLRLSGGYALTEWRTVISLSAAIGRIEQDARFLEYSSNPNLETEPLPRSSLDGEVRTSNLVLSLNARPLPNTRIRASYRYDERDNETGRDLYSRVVVDAFLSGEQQANLPFGYERSKLTFAADWDPLSKVRLSAGLERRDLDRTQQEVSSQDEFTSYGRLRLRPAPAFEIDARYGNSRREIDDYDEALAVASGQNPLLRKYNLAYRFRNFYDLRASWSPASLPLAVTFTGLQADDSYTHSQLGLTDGDEKSYALDLSWFVGEGASVFLNVAADDITARQTGSESFAAPDWNARNDDAFRSWGGGFSVAEIGGTLDLRFSAITSRGTSEIALDSSDGADQFPDLKTDLDRLRLDLRYRQSAALDLSLAAVYQRFSTADWALQDVAPDAVPLLFSLGAQPYDDENVILTLGFRYRMGSR